MPELECTLSQVLWELLQADAKRTPQPVAHIVSQSVEGVRDRGHEESPNYI